ESWTPSEKLGGGVRHLEEEEEEEEEE
ncbi:hypothetical protein A2U01_0057455, partial [Trifolium medium]|nr:hypothetical protein [Trifolium medium]